MMKYMDRVLFGAVATLGLSFGSTVMACSPDGWTTMGDNIETPSLVGTPVDGVARYSEFCAFSVDGDSSYVQSNHSDDTRYFGRFYMFPNVADAGSADVFVAYSDEAATAELFKVSYDGSSITFTVPGDTATVAAVSGWNLIEFEYDADTETFNYWVNQPWDFDGLAYTDGDGYSGSVSMTDGDIAVKAVQMGAPNTMGGLTGKINFDAFEAHRTSNVGALIACDADGTGNPDININDILAVINERFGSPQVLAMGQPDCNGDGSVNLNDILDTIAVAF